MANITQKCFCEVCHTEFEQNYWLPKRHICENCREKLLYYVKHGRGYVCEDDTDEKGKE